MRVVGDALSKLSATATAGSGGGAAGTGAKAPEAANGPESSLTPLSQSPRMYNGDHNKAVVRNSCTSPRKAQATLEARNNVGLLGAKTFPKSRGDCHESTAG